MANPLPLYVVLMTVVASLVAWVVTVWTRPAAAGRVAASPAGTPGAEAHGANAPLDAPAAKVPRGAETAGATALSRGDPPEEDDPTGPHALILVTAVGRTDPGRKRAHNEDAYAILEAHRLFVIADGMGRHAAGEVASRLCVEAITEAFRTSQFGPPGPPSLARRAARLRGAIRLANERIQAAAEANDAYAGMGTTVVGAYFSQSNQRVYIGHVGDSRCYRFRAGELTLLTTDHTLGNAGIQGRTSIVLSRAVGIEPDVEVEITVESPLPGDVYLLCSDGLSRSLSHEQIRATLASAGTLDQTAAVLIESANATGGSDNITTILVRVDAAPAS
jgi:protein phosphatase